MSGWQVSSLGEVADFILGKMLDQAKNKGELRPYLANVNVRWGEFDLEDLRNMRFEPREVERYSLRYGDILMCEGGEPGRCAIWKTRGSGLMFQKALHRIRPHDCLDSSFLYYSFLSLRKSDGFAGYFTGATIKHLPREQLAKVEVRFPEKAEQQKIAAILSTYDDLIANNQRRITLLERMAEDIYREWFVRLRFPGHENVKIEKGVPQGWTTMPSDAAFEILGGGTPNTDTAAYWNGDIPFFTPKDAAENIYAISTEKNITENGLRASSTQLFPKNTVFITARGTVGKLALAGQAMAMNQSCYALKPKQCGAVYFHYLAIRESITYIKGVSKSGVFDNIVMDTFKNVPILMPPDSLIESFNRQIEPLFKQVVNLLEQRQCLAKTRDSLLPRLISGKLSVDALDIRFPPGMVDADA